MARMIDEKQFITEVNEIKQQIIVKKQKLQQNKIEGVQLERDIYVLTGQGQGIERVLQVSLTAETMDEVKNKRKKSD